MKRGYFPILISVLIIALMAIINPLIKNDVHEWRNDGKCMQCHSEHNQTLIQNKTIKDALVIPPPRSHSEQFRRYTHGKTQNFSYERCSSCHLQNECKSCHNILPESHTQDFVTPSGQGMERHILLATINPASCLTCHESFTVQCVNCHTPEEVKPWEKQAKKLNINEVY